MTVTLEDVLKAADDYRWSKADYEDAADEAFAEELQQNTSKELAAVRARQRCKSLRDDMLDKFRLFDEAQAGYVYEREAQGELSDIYETVAAIWDRENPYEREADQAR